MKLSLKALLLSGAAIGAIALIPFVVNAQTTVPQFLSQFRPMQQLNLTADQRAKLKETRQATRAQLENLLTAEQKQQFQTAIADGKAPMEAIESLNLSETQRSQARAILQTAHQQTEAVLTPEQKQQMRQVRQTLWQQALTGNGQIPDEIVQKLNLSADQQTQLSQLRQDTRTKLEDLLTSDQRSHLETAMAQGDALPNVVRSLHLTTEQRNQGRQILQESRQKAASVFTADQKKQMRQMFRDRLAQ